MPATNDAAASVSPDKFLRPGPCLLVPVTVEALVVTTRGQLLGWQYNANTYTEMRRFGSIEPLPFSQVTKAPPTGVTLHWTLPDAVTHGVEDSQGEIEYPAVPNRWVVARTHENPARPGEILIKAWVVRSDFLNAATGTSPFPDPFSTTRTATRIGAFVIQEQWTGEAGPGSDFVLKAVGPATRPSRLTL